MAETMLQLKERNALPMGIPSVQIDDVEAWNDAFALENDIDAYYSDSSVVIRFIEARRLQCIKRMVAARPGESILEVGCGGGHVMQMFPEAKLTGLDVSGRQLDKARRNLRGFDAQLIKGELHTAELGAASFDKIICTEVLEHSINPKKILKGIRRLLQPGGRAIITFPNDCLIEAVKGLVRATGIMQTIFPRISWGGDDYHLHKWPVAEMRQLLSCFFCITEESFAPSRFFPIRCCFQCAVDQSLPDVDQAAHESAVVGL